MTKQFKYLYALRDQRSQLVKIGVTDHWERRAKQLKVGQHVDALLVVRCHNPLYQERRLHKMFSDERLPQSEWFNLNTKKVERVLEEMKALGPELSTSYVPITSPDINTIIPNDVPKVAKAKKAKRRYRCMEFYPIPSDELSFIRSSLKHKTTLQSFQADADEFGKVLEVEVLLKQPHPILGSNFWIINYKNKETGILTTGPTGNRHVRPVSTVLSMIN